MEPEETLELFPFAYWDEMRGRWMKARYVASLADIQARYPKHRIEGKPEIREGDSGQFMPPTRDGA